MYFFVFDNIEVGLTGDIFLSYPYYDPWNLPWPCEVGDLDPVEEAVLTFSDGELVEELITNIDEC